LSHIFFPFKIISILSDIATIFGVLYNCFLITNRKYSLHLALVNNVLIGIIALLQSVYLTAAYSILYCVPSLIIGIIRQKKTTTNNEVIIKKLTLKQALLSLIIFIALGGVFTVILYYIGGNLFVLDAFTNAGLIISLYLVTKNNYYCYYYYILASILGIALYTFLTIQDTANAILLVLWLIYFAGDFLGLSQWKKKYKIQNQPTLSD
jgi:nicotinamide mononucleotide transporter PnuC